MIWFKKLNSLFSFNENCTLIDDNVSKCTENSGHVSANDDNNDRHKIYQW